ncbi:hypothetical protein BW31_01998 [Pantoea agglomerans]|nr:hypothetical protein BW31_01998 [Pantoea agglomerans]
MAVFGRTEGHVAAAQGEIFTGDHVAAVHVKLVTGTEGDASVAAPHRAAAAECAAGVGAALLHRLTHGETDAASAHQARFFLLTLMHFITRFCGGRDAEIAARGQRHILRTGDVAAGHGNVAARLKPDAVAAQRGTERLAAVQFVVGFQTAARQQPFARLPAVFGEIGTAVARTEHDVASGAGDQCPARRDVRCRSADILSGTQLQRAAGGDA